MFDPYIGCGYKIPRWNRIQSTLDVAIRPTLKRLVTLLELYIGTLPHWSMFTSAMAELYTMRLDCLCFIIVINFILCRRYGAKIELRSHYANRTFYVFLY